MSATPMPITDSAAQKACLHRNAHASVHPGRVFKVALDGTVLGVIGRSGHNLGQFSGAHALACPTERELYVTETSNWRVQKRPPEARV